MKSIFTLLFLGFVYLASAQNTFKTRLFPADDGYTEKTAQLNDGSFVSVGYLSANDDMWLIKTSATGTVLASKQISGSDYEEGTAIVKTTDGGFAVTGSLNDQIGLLKYDANLNLIWKQEYDASVESIGLALVQTADGGYFIGGYSSNPNDDVAGTLIKTNNLGVIQFQQRYFSYAFSYILDLSPTTDGNYAFLAGDDENGGKYIGKIKPDGSIVWVQEYDDIDFDLKGLDDVLGTSDGGVVATGYAEESANNDLDEMAMVKLNASGALVWSKVLRNTTGCAAYAVREDRDGGYLFAGLVNASTSPNPYVVKTTSAGALAWKKTFETDPNGYTEFSALIATSDGGFVTTGDGYILKQGGDYADAGTIYKFTGSFDACGETAGTDDGVLADAGSVAAKTLSVRSTTLVTVSPDFTTTDADNEIYYVCNSLPVHLTSFTAALQGKSVGVNWTTANEVNADYFVVERSGDKSSFTALQKVAAKGNSSITQSYGINDLQPLQGTSYYRLREVDKDGKLTYSSIASVTVMINGTIVISPNPVQNNIRVIVQSTVNNNLSLQVIDMKGNLLAAQMKAVGAGRNEINIPASSLAKGVYVLKVTDNKTTQTIRFVKE